MQKMWNRILLNDLVVIKHINQENFVSKILIEHYFLTVL